MRCDVAAKQIPVELDRLGPQVRSLLDPGDAVVREQDLARVGIDPLAIEDLGLLTSEPDFSVGLARKGLVCRAHYSVRSPIPCLPLAKWQLAESAKPASPCFLVGQYYSAPGHGWCRGISRSTRTTTAGSCRPDSRRHPHPTAPRSARSEEHTAAIP